MAAILVCPICGSLPADNGSDQTKTNNVVNATTGLDVNGNAAHCPLCGTATLVVDQTKVQTETGVAAASQKSADVDAVYVVSANSSLAQPDVAAYSLVGRPAVYPHGYATPQRGTVAITPETINGAATE